jgi:hypothetical protein
MKIEISISNFLNKFVGSMKGGLLPIVYTYTPLPLCLQFSQKKKNLCLQSRIPKILKFHIMPIDKQNAFHGRCKCGERARKSNHSE